jgi:hypothetical protein
MEISVEPQATKNADQKYCGDCGKLILRRAELCPGCGCRQMAAPKEPSLLNFSETASSVAISAGNVGKMLITPARGAMLTLLVLNVFWCGLGNVAIGDSRGWKYGLANWLFFVASFFTFGIPCFCFFVYCSYEGQQFLQKIEATSVSPPTPVAL